MKDKWFNQTAEWLVGIQFWIDGSAAIVIINILSVQEYLSDTKSEHEWNVDTELRQLPSLLFHNCFAYSFPKSVYRSVFALPENAFSITISEIDLLSF